MIDVDIWYIISVMITSDLQMASIFPNRVVHMAEVGACQVDKIFHRNITNAIKYDFLRKLLVIDFWSETCCLVGETESYIALHSFSL